jgi:hypothetical protein
MSGDVTLMPCSYYMSLEALNPAPLSSKQSACVFLLGTPVIVLRSVVLPVTVLQPDVFLLQIQFVNL